MVVSEQYEAWHWSEIGWALYVQHVRYDLYMGGPQNPCIWGFAHGTRMTGFLGRKTPDVATDELQAVS